MKALFYLIVLIIIALTIAWFGFGMHPKTVYYKTLSVTHGVAKHSEDLKNTGNRFVDVIKNNYNDQDMTQPIEH